MPFNGSGTFTRDYVWVNDKIAGTPITASRVDDDSDDFASGLSSVITKDGQTTLTANIPFSNFKITGLGNGSARNDSIALGQVQDGSYTYLGTTTGSADAYTVAPAPTITAYATTQRFFAKIHATNTTTTPYLQISAIANPTTTAVIKKLSATKTEIALEASDLIANGLYEFQRNSANDAWIVLNPEKLFYNFTNGTKATSTTQGIVYLPNPVSFTNNTTDANNDMDFTQGVINYDDGSGQSVSSLNLTKQLDATFVEGTNAGGLDTGTKANSTWYQIFAITKNTTGVVDFLYSTSRTSPTIPSGWTRRAWLGAIRTNSSGNIDQKYFAKRTTFGQITQILTGEVATGTNTVLLSDAIPDNAKGNQFMELQIIPLSSTSRLEIDVIGHLVNNNGSNIMIGFLCRDALTNALATNNYAQTATGYEGFFNFKYSEISNTTSAITYKFRAGSSGGGTNTFNGDSGVRQFGGTYASSITIKEYL